MIYFSPCYCDLSSSRISFHSAKQSQHVPHLFKNASLLKVPSSLTNPTRSSPDSRLYSCPANNCGPIQSPKTTQSATGFADGCTSPTIKKKKKKKKRRNSEMEIPTAEPAAKTEQHENKLTSEVKTVKKRKKRKREEEQSSVTVQRESMQSHLAPSGQDEDWCLGETWRINPNGNTERPKQQPQLNPEPTLSQAQEQIQAMFCETSQNQPIVKKKKKKKHKEKLDQSIVCDISDRLVVFSTFSTVVPNSLINIVHIVKPCMMQHSPALLSFTERLK